MSPRLLTLILALATLASAVPAGGQVLATTPLLTDDTGDVDVVLAGSPAGDGSGAYPSADLVALSLSEGASEFVLVLEVADLKPSNEDTGADGVEYEVRFEHHGRFFLLRIYRDLPLFGGNPVVYLDARDAADGYWGSIWSSDEAIAMDFAADTITVTLPRVLLADADGAAPFPGRNLTAISVRSSSGFTGGSISFGGPSGPFQMPYTIVDNMPELDQPPATYAVLIGVQQTGHAHLASPTPFRASNGEATTFVYQLEASNLGDDNETFELTASNVAQRVTVVLPVPIIPIPANTTVTVPVLATVPFAHVHGELDTFLLELTSLDDAGSVGRLEMGINYLAVPQPAGHHDVLFLHNPANPAATPGLGSGLLPYNVGTMSTVEDADKRPNFYSQDLTFSGLGSSFSWEYALAPALAMGLDVDLNRTGHATIAVGTTAPLLQATLEGQMFVSGREGGAFVGAFAPQAPVDIAAQSTHTFELDFIPDAEADLVPLQPGSNLFLSIRLFGSTVPTAPEGDTGPYLAPGASLRLPLNEFHDDVDDALSAVDGPVLESLGPQERLVNPGEAVVFNVSVENPTNESIPFRLAITGSNVAWAVLPEDSFVMPPESTANVSLIVRAPKEALDGDRADVILQAYPRDEPSLRGLIRLLVEVDTDVDHVDEAPLADKLSKDKDAPAPPLALVALALLAVAWGRRRSS